MTEDSLKVFEMIAILHVQCVIRNFLKKKFNLFEFEEWLYFYSYL